jgi:hypothetical protein
MVERKNPPLRARGRRAGSKDVSNNCPNTRLSDPLQGCISIVEVDAIIGAAFFGLITILSVYDPHVQRREWWPFKSGRRKGQFRWVVVSGEKRLRSVRVRRYHTPGAAALAYSATRRALGMGLLPHAFDGHDLRIMGWATLTPAGAASDKGRAFAKRLRSLGVGVCDNPMEARRPGEFWWVDCAAR